MKKIVAYGVTIVAAAITGVLIAWPPQFVCPAMNTILGDDYEYVEAEIVNYSLSDSSADCFDGCEKDQSNRSGAIGMTIQHHATVKYVNVSGKMTSLKKYREQIEQKPKIEFCGKKKIVNGKTKYSTKLWLVWR